MERVSCSILLSLLSHPLHQVPRYCARHKEPDHVNIRACLCEYPLCGKQASFGPLGSTGKGRDVPCR
eukprot:766055-Hanusia_phi.AAC.3